jgi:hypothetical protein
VITDFVAFHYVFSSCCAQSIFTALLVKHSPIAGTLRALPVKHSPISGALSALSEPYRSSIHQLQELWVLSQSPTGQAFTNCRSSESSEAKYDSPTIYDIYLSFFWGWEHVFSEVLTWLITYFHHTYRHSPMESDCPCSKRKQGPISMSLAFH